jgi:multiple sugar transport system substrate-binding protein
MKKYSIFIAVIMVLSIVLSACTTQTTEEPEKTIIEFWTTDNEEERILAYEMVADAFMALHPEIDLRIVAIEEAGVAQRIATAQAANRLPGIVRMGVERVSSFAADGILDLDAAQAVIESIGADDFQAGPLAMVTDPETGKYAAIPFDGWVQALWYRTDIFENLGLSAPISWDDIDTACDSLAGNDDLVYSMTLGTDPGQNYPHQVFEQVAISNNAWPFDTDGNVTMNTPEMIEALAWYAGLQRCAMPGPQYWRGARESYELGQTGMMWYSTYIMDDLVDGSGMEDGGTVALVDNLAANSGFAPSIESESGSATYGQLVTLAVLDGADPMAQEVVKFFMTGQNYLDILAVAPMGKVPVLKSAVEGWRGLSDYFGYYSEETITQIADGYENMQRWLFRPDYGSVERAVIGDIEGTLLIPQAISYMVLEETMTAEEAADWLQEQVVALLAERAE